MAADASPFDRYRDAELTLDDLVVAAARLLRRLDLRPGDGRVAPAPDARGVRYYQGIGVLDRPLRYDGRRAVYGFRHLLQLLAVKQLQQEGHPLHLIQQSLAGRPTATLEQALGTMLTGRESGRSREPQAWAAEPMAALAVEPVAALAGELIHAAGPRAAEPAALVAARLAPGVTITVDPSVVANPDALIAHIAATLAELHKEH
jgi:DNA-binding transcriptional MerR regulator